MSLEEKNNNSCIKYNIESGWLVVSWLELIGWLIAPGGVWGPVGRGGVGVGCGGQ